MRRDGRQHGLVMTIHPAGLFQPPRPGLVLDASDSPPTTAFRTRVPAKPTNHSKYTGRSPGHHRRHHHPPSKSRDKSKGARKLRGLDVGLNPRLASWRVVAGTAREGWRLAAGGSASSAAVYLSGYPLEEDEEGARWGYLYDEQKWVANNVDEEEEERVEEVGGGEMDAREDEEAEEGGEVEQEGLEEDGGDNGDEDDDDDMDFCEVWAVWDYVDEEDWCVVGEMEI